jgi:DNA-directed RNA polymerase specialized sigma24 family protein
MDQDTDIGGARRSFPTTHASVIRDAGSADEDIRRRAFGALVAVYWKPVYFHLRLRWQTDSESAKDLTQEFFAQAMSRGFFDDFDPERARFRTFLRTCLDHFVANARRAERRLKRGGGMVHLPLDFDGADRELGQAGAVSDGEADARFHEEWVRSLFTVAVDGLKAEAETGGYPVRFRVFERYDLEPASGSERPSYRDLADELHIPVTQVTNHLAWARRAFRRLVLERLRELSGSDAEFREEARSLLGVEPE